MEQQPEHEFSATDRIIGAGLFVSRVLKRFVSFFPPNAPLYMSERYRGIDDAVQKPEKYAWQMQFDLEQDVQRQLHVTPAERGIQNRWDESGRYFED
jgi:hypothetical protein